MAEKRPSGRSRTREPVVAPDAQVDGAMAARTRALIAALELDEDDHRRLTLAELALTLALTLDGGVGMATAAVSKELRATLAELEGEDADVDDDLSLWAAELGQPS